MLCIQGSAENQSYTERTLWLNITFTITITGLYNAIAIYIVCTCKKVDLWHQLSTEGW